MFFVQRFNGRAWIFEPEGRGLPNRSEALWVVERLRGFYGPRTLFRIVVR